LIEDGKDYFSQCGIEAEEASGVSTSDGTTAIGLLAGEELSFGVEAFEWVVESGVRERGEKMKSMRYAWRRTSTPRAAVENARV
jgi:hypothetical protein